jgi:catechol 2,3-dioxygenase-like lactoylglutathione lyase family enzyme
MKSIRHAGIVITDRKKALRFYRDLLGLKIFKDANESGEFIDEILGLTNVKVNTIKMSADDGGLIELLCYSSHPQKTDSKRKIYSIGASHVAFTVDNLDKTFKKLKKAGINFISLPKISPDGNAKVVFCEDPDGTPIELVEIIRK